MFLRAKNDLVHGMLLGKRWERQATIMHGHVRYTHLLKCATSN
jgi:hypothetical protein